MHNAVRSGIDIANCATRLRVMASFFTPERAITLVVLAPGGPESHLGTSRQATEGDTPALQEALHKQDLEVSLTA